MSRRGAAEEETAKSDLIYRNRLVNMLVNRILKQGKKSLAYQIIYQAVKKIQQKAETNPLSVLCQAIRGVTPDITIAGFLSSPKLEPSPEALVEPKVLLSSFLPSPLFIPHCPPRVFPKRSSMGVLSYLGLACGLVNGDYSFLAAPSIGIDPILISAVGSGGSEDENGKLGP
ncbi:hypothetical protein M9H77_07977 [Catharanthus roseus]|uniref:Uncharacterized protein n=1 Tax=Catharanthus roseus TaxID=4058 RepID=A0ACC0BWP6_CATRO|nr:hypothetical protein M9H77_07977 [Catharanthus roseus]